MLAVTIRSARAASSASSVSLRSCVASSGASAHRCRRAAARAARGGIRQTEAEPRQDAFPPRRRAAARAAACTDSGPRPGGVTSAGASGGSAAIVGAADVGSTGKGERAAGVCARQRHGGIEQGRFAPLVELRERRSGNRSLARRDRLRAGADRAFSRTAPRAGRSPNWSPGGRRATTRTLRPPARPACRRRPRCHARPHFSRAGETA